MFPYNVDPQTYSLSAVFIGVILTQEFNAHEANTLGNWFELLGDYLLAYAGQASLIQNNQRSQTNQNQMTTIIQAIKKIEKELEQIKRNYPNE